MIQFKFISSYIYFPPKYTVYIYSITTIYIAFTLDLGFVNLQMISNIGEN